MVAVDYFVKYAVTSHMSLGQSIPVFENVFHITYVQNTGAAFSIFSGKMTFLTIITALVLLGIIIFIAVKRPQSKIVLLSLTMIFAGGCGNMIDRISKGYVVDMFDFRLINFAVFNAADVFVVCGCILLVIHSIFFDINGEKYDIKS